MNTPDHNPLAEAGLEPPPASPFDVGAADGVAPRTAEPAGLRLNRATRRRLRAVTLADARLLARVARYDVEVRHAGLDVAAVYQNERAATYGLEHAATAMRRASRLTAAELQRVKLIARGRRAALKS